MARTSPSRNRNIQSTPLGGLNRFLSQWLNRLPPSVLEIFQDRYLWALLIVALVVNLGLFAYLIFEFNSGQSIPPLVPLHFIAGEPDRIEPRDGLFSLAQIGLIVILGNLGLGVLIYRRERLACYLLAATSVVVQILLWTAAIQIIRFVTL